MACLKQSSLFKKKPLKRAFCYTREKPWIKRSFCLRILNTVNEYAFCKQHSLKEFLLYCREQKGYCGRSLLRQSKASFRNQTGNWRFDLFQLSAFSLLFSCWARERATFHSHSIRCVSIAYARSNSNYACLISMRIERNTSKELEFSLLSNQFGFSCIFKRFLARKKLPYPIEVFHFCKERSTDARSASGSSGSNA